MDACSGCSSAKICIECDLDIEKIKELIKKKCIKDEEDDGGLIFY